MDDYDSNQYPYVKDLLVAHGIRMVLPIFMINMVLLLVPINGAEIN